MDISTWEINYAEIMREVPDSAPTRLKALSRKLSAAWLKVYKQCVPHYSRINVIPLDGYDYIFDDASTATQPEAAGSVEFICERLVAVHGQSQPTDRIPRDESRIRGFPRGAASDVSVVESVRHDRGHFIAHASGGGADINLFPQFTDVNRGWSNRGKVYRRMEKYLADNPGTYGFSRPIYSGWTDHPYVIEFGLLKDGEGLWVELFPNCRSEDEMRAIEVAFAERMREHERD